MKASSPNRIRGRAQLILISLHRGRLIRLSSCVHFQISCVGGIVGLCAVNTQINVLPHFRDRLSSLLSNVCSLSCDCVRLAAVEMCVDELCTPSATLGGVVGWVGGVTPRLAFYTVKLVFPVNYKCTLFFRGKQKREKNVCRLCVFLFIVVVFVVLCPAFHHLRFLAVPFHYVFVYISSLCLLLYSFTVFPFSAYNPIID